MMKRARLTVRIVDNYSGKSESFVVEEGNLRGVADKIKSCVCKELAKFIKKPAKRPA